MNDTDALLQLAAAASAQAYAPYSRLHVGAALKTERGALYSGCNVENAAFPSGGCAEHHAIAAAVRAEGPAMRISAIAIHATTANGQPVAIPPCGACRQRILEFGRDARVSFAGTDGTIRHCTIAELLPASFHLPADNLP